MALQLVIYNHFDFIGEAQTALEKILGELTEGSLKKEEPLSKDQRLGTVARTLVKGAELVSINVLLSLQSLLEIFGHL